MSAKKTERLMNLLVMLLAARAPVTRERIRQMIEGYHGLDDINFERTFERDKLDLRAAGVPIDSDGDRYGIHRAAYELPPISFTPEELAALGAAATVWRDQVAADTTRQALVTLQAAGAEPDASRLEAFCPRLEPANHLELWRQGIVERREVRFSYGTQHRRLQPWRLLNRRGRWYVIGHDLERGAARRFRLDKVSTAPRLVGEAGAFTAPEVVPTDFETSHETARVAVRTGRGRDLVGSAMLAADQTGAPDGFEVFELPRSFGIAGAICALGADAVALAPADLVTEVVAQLENVAGAAR